MVGKAAQQVVVGREIFRMLARGDLRTRVFHLSVQRRDDRADDLVLHGENIVERAIVALRPEVIAGCRVDELGRDPDARAGPPHAAFEDIADTELPTDTPHVAAAVAKLERRVARDDRYLPKARQFRDDVLGDAVREILLLRVAATCW